jgi:hypothetical protein
MYLKYHSVQAALALLLVGALFGVWFGWEHVPVAQAQDEANCDSFDSQAEAQRHMRAWSHVYQLGPIME